MPKVKFDELEKYILSIEKHSKESNRIKVMRDYAIERLEEYRRA